MTKVKHPYQLLVFEVREYSSSNIHSPLGSQDTGSKIDNNQLAYSMWLISAVFQTHGESSTQHFFPQKTEALWKKTPVFLLPWQAEEIFDKKTINVVNAPAISIFSLNQLPPNQVPEATYFSYTIFLTS